MRTSTPTLDPAVLDRLREYAALFADDFPRAEPARWAGVYLQGLLPDGERKSTEPLSHRVRLPDGLAPTDPEQALQQFVDQSPRDEHAVLERYRTHLARTFARPEGIFLFDDVSFPKQGTHSVGVQRQSRGALGKKAHCQVAVSAHHVGPRGHHPPDRRLYLPDSWLADPKRPDQAGAPEDRRRSRTEPEIAPGLLDRVRGEGPRGRAVVADAGYGVSGTFRAGPDARGLEYVAGVTGELVVSPEQPRWIRPARPSRGRPRTRSRLAPNNPRPVSPRAVAARLPRRRVAWREGTRGKLSGRSAWVRVWPGRGWATGDCADAGPVRRLIEEPADGTLTFASPNPPADTRCIAAVRLWKSRRPVEQGYQRPKEELGLDHFGGAELARVPPPRGDDHSGPRVLAAGAASGRTGPPRAGKRGGAGPVPTLPGVRRALQRLLMPLAKLECP